MAVPRRRNQPDRFVTIAINAAPRELEHFEQRLGGNRIRNIDGVVIETSVSEQRRLPVRSANFINSNNASQRRITTASIPVWPSRWKQELLEHSVNDASSCQYAEENNTFDAASDSDASVRGSFLGQRFSLLGARRSQIAGA